MGSVLLGEIAFEVLADEQVCGLDPQFPDQQVDTDYRQFFWVARAVIGLPLRPRRIDPGMYGYVCHGGSRSACCAWRCLVAEALGRWVAWRSHADPMSAVNHFARRFAPVHGHHADDMPHLGFFEFRETAVQIDLKDPGQFTEAAVRQLIASGQDSVHNQLRVTSLGVAFLSTAAVGGVAIDGLCFRFETWSAGSGCVGEVAACDEVWVRQIYNALREHWTHPGQDYIDVY